MTMKQRFYLTGALVLLLALVASVALVSADQPAAPPAAQAAGTLEGPRWVLVSYAGPDGKTIQAIPGTETTAQFANGTVSGSAGCNRYNAPYTVDGNKIQIGLGMSTMMACPPPIMDQEAAYLANLQAAASYKIAGDQLTLANAKGSTVLTFKAEIPISLTDGTWVLTSHNNGKGGVVSGAVDAEVTAVFGADGRLSGSAGCNTYSAPYTVDGNKIKIGLAISTMMMCAQPVMEQEQQYLAAIQQAATYNIQGTRLELRSADGALQASYTPSARRSLRAGRSHLADDRLQQRQAGRGLRGGGHRSDRGLRRGRPAQRLGRLQHATMRRTPWTAPRSRSARRPPPA